MGQEKILMKMTTKTPITDLLNRAAREWYGVKDLYPIIEEIKDLQVTLGDFVREQDSINSFIKSSKEEAIVAMASVCCFYHNKYEILNTINHTVIYNKPDVFRHFLYAVAYFRTKESDLLTEVQRVYEELTGNSLDYELFLMFTSEFRGAGGIHKSCLDDVLNLIFSSHVKENQAYNGFVVKHTEVLSRMNDEVVSLFLRDYGTDIDSLKFFESFSEVDEEPDPADVKLYLKKIFRKKNIPLLAEMYASALDHLVFYPEEYEDRFFLPNELYVSDAFNEKFLISIADSVKEHFAEYTSKIESREKYRSFSLDAPLDIVQAAHGQNGIRDLLLDIKNHSGKVSDKMLKQISKRAEASVIKETGVDSRIKRVHIEDDFSM